MVGTDTGDTRDTEAVACMERMAPTIMRRASREIEHMLSIRVVTWSLGVFGAVTFVVCVAYGLVVPASLHMTPWLEAVLPGFRWLTLPGFVLGLVEAFLYGAYTGLVFTPIYNAFWRRWSGPRG
jgi:hypothetical protein